MGVKWLLYTLCIINQCARVQPLIAKVVSFLNVNFRSLIVHNAGGNKRVQDVIENPIFFIVARQQVI